MSERKWKKVTADFQKDLARGRIGELALLEACGTSVTPLDGKHGDLQVKKTGEKLEIKTDNYDHSKTNNFFLERYSYGFQPGGPFQSLAHGCKYFIYCFSNPGFFYIFNTEKLCKRLLEIQSTNRYTLIDIPNKGFTTRGWKLPRELFADLELTWEDIGVKFNATKYSEFISFNKAQP